MQAVAYPLACSRAGVDCIHSWVRNPWMPWQCPYWPWVWLCWPVRMQARLTAHDGLVQNA